ncbi:hypothetical protein ACP275_01G069400 [Erythranthe tilingii]
MKINFMLLVIVLTASVVCFCGTADSEGNVGGTKNSVGNGTVNETVDPAKKDEGSDLDKNDSKEKLVSKGGENGQKKGEIKENDGSDSGSGKEANGASLLPLREKCDSSSNRCMDDDKTFVACLRVPGNESPALSLLIQNMGKGSLSINISAPDLVKLEKNQIELEEKKDTEVKVSITGIESGHIIILTAGHGNCSLNIRDQLLGKNKIDHSNEPPKPNIFNPTLSTAFLLIVAALLIVVLSVFVCTKLGVKYFARKVPKYQKLDMDLPVSHGSRIESGEIKGWDDSWDDSWDDEEAPKTPSLPLTPSLSSKGMASRKFSKESWKD